MYFGYREKSLELLEISMNSSKSKKSTYRGRSRYRERSRSRGRKRDRRRSHHRHRENRRSRQSSSSCESKTTEESQEENLNHDEKIREKTETEEIIRAEVKAGRNSATLEQQLDSNENIESVALPVASSSRDKEDADLVESTSTKKLDREEEKQIELDVATIPLPGEIFEIVSGSSEPEVAAKTVQMEKESATEKQDDDKETEDETIYYIPSKVKLGCKHPNPTIEIASLARVIPPDVTYQLALSEDTINNLSSLQLEAIIYSCQHQEQILLDKSRAGFLIGDGPGVGKGRIVAGIIFENYLQGRKKSIWISASSDLKHDAERDLRDIGAKITVHALNKMKDADISAKCNGSVHEGVIFLSYTTLSHGKCRSRRGQLVKWCGEDFDGVIVFDERCSSKSGIPTFSKKSRTYSSVLELQTKLPNARVVYISANGVSEPRNMQHMIRLGIWGEGQCFKGNIFFKFK